MLQELAEARDTPSDMVFDELWAAAFADQPLGRSILGDEASIRAGHRRRPPRLARPAISRRRPDRSPPPARSITTSWSRWPSGTSPTCRTARPADDAARFTGGVARRPAASEQAQLTFGFRRRRRSAPTIITRRGLFADIVGGGASSRLFQEVREERGLAYSRQREPPPLCDTGLFYIHAATRRARRRPRRS